MRFMVPLSLKAKAWHWKKIAFVLTMITIIGELVPIIYWSITLYWTSDISAPIVITHLLSTIVLGVIALFVLILWSRFKYPSLVTVIGEAGNKSSTNNPANPSQPPTPPHNVPSNDANMPPTTQVPSQYNGANDTSSEAPPQQIPGANMPSPAPPSVQPPQPIHERRYTFNELRYFIFPKEAGNEPRFCADKCSINRDTGRFAVTDGVSRSFLSPEWADIIATNYTNRSGDFASKEDFIAWLTQCSQQWEQWVITRWIPDAEKNGLYESWDEKIYEGAQTTFVGCSIFPKPNNSLAIWIHAVGDANLFCLHPTTAQQDTTTWFAFPNTEPRTHQSATDTLSTPARRFQRTYDLIKKTEITAQPGDYLFLVTDALMNWILTPPEATGSHLYALLQIDSESSFRSFVMSERNEKRLEEDDTTMLIIPL